MILFRQNPTGYPFLWEDSRQPAARWHAMGEGPVQYLSDTPDGAWAEFLRHQDITDPADLAGIQRDIWAIEIPDNEGFVHPKISQAVCTGDKTTYALCQEEARRLRGTGATGILAASAALITGGACGVKVDGGVKSATPRDGKNHILFGRRSDVCGWKAASSARPSEEILGKVRYF